MYQVAAAMFCVCLLSRGASGMSVSQEETLMSVQELKQELSDIYKLPLTIELTEEVKSSRLLSLYYSLCLTYRLENDTHGMVMLTK